MSIVMSVNLKGARQYLETGGLGEVIGLAHMAMKVGHEKVQMDTDMALALCHLASEALQDAKRKDGEGLS